MHLYAAMTLRFLSALAVVLGLILGLGKIAETGDIFWAVPAVFGAVLGYALWRASDHVLDKGVDADSVPF